MFNPSNKTTSEVLAGYYTGGELSSQNAYDSGYNTGFTDSKANAVFWWICTDPWHYGTMMNGFCDGITYGVNTSHTSTLDTNFGKLYIEAQHQEGTVKLGLKPDKNGRILDYNSKEVLYTVSKNVLTTWGTIKTAEVNNVIYEFIPD